MDPKILTEAARRLTELMRENEDVRVGVHAVYLATGSDSLVGLAEDHPDAFLELVEEMEQMVAQSEEGLADQRRRRFGA